MVGCVAPAGALQDDMTALGVETFALGATSRAGFPAAIVRLARLLRRRRARVVQTHLVDGCLVGLAAARLARIPIVVMTAHHSHELPFHGRRLIWPERVCAGPLSDHVIAPSAQVAETLVEHTGIARDKVEVVHHGFDLGRLDPVRVSGDAVRRELGLSGDAPVLAAIGRLYRMKNLEALLRAFAVVSTRERLLIGGPGDPGALRALAGRLGVADRVVLAGPRSDVPEVLAACDAFVHPALAESFGMVIVEAMAMARPILAPPVGIAGEVVETGVTGVLARSPGEADLATGLQELLALRARWPEMGRAARDRVAGFTAVAMTARHEELYARWDQAACSAA
jgi:glycosyltransferase involved in cell wall biosynthesis